MGARTGEDFQREWDADEAATDARDDADLRTLASGARSGHSGNGVVIRQRDCGQACSDRGGNDRFGSFGAIRCGRSSIERPRSIRRR